MTRTEKAIKDAISFSENDSYRIDAPDVTYKNLRSIHVLYLRELDIIRFDAIIFGLACLCIGLVVGLIINA